MTTERTSFLDEIKGLVANDLERRQAEQVAASVEKQRGKAAAVEVSMHLLEFFRDVADASSGQLSWQSGQSLDGGTLTGVGDPPKRRLEVHVTDERVRWRMVGGRTDQVITGPDIKPWEFSTQELHDPIRRLLDHRAWA